MPQEYTALVVDDEPSVGNVIRDYLDNCGFNPTHVKSAQEALAQLSNGNLPHLLITDVMMPVKNGAELLEDLVGKQKDGRFYIPTLVMSGMCPEDLGAKAKDYAVRLYKPEHLEKLQRSMGSDFTDLKDFVWINKPIGLLQFQKRAELIKSLYS